MFIYVLFMFLGGWAAWTGYVNNDPVLLFLGILAVAANALAAGIDS